MMKDYKQALETLFMMASEHLGFELNYEKSLLQELVDKATPKKPIIEGPFIREEDTFCPNCKNNICLTPSSKPNFCWCCGQELDWSTDE